MKTARTVFREGAARRKESYAMAKSTAPHNREGSPGDSALELAKLGYYVFPCQWIRKDGRCSCLGKSPNCSPGKHPLGAAAPHGFKDATRDPEQINKWWDKWPMANIGIACGASGIVVIDIDNKPDRPGKETWAQLKKNSD